MPFPDVPYVQHQMKLSAQDPEDCEAGDLVFYEAMTGVSQQKIGGF